MRVQAFPRPADLEKAESPASFYPGGAPRKEHAGSNPLRDSALFEFGSAVSRHKEVIVSFALIEVRSADEALELSRRFWKIAGDGEDDIRQVFGPVRVVTPDTGTAAAHHAIEGCGGWSRPG